MFEDIHIISGGDSNYFELLKELAFSIRSKNEGKNLKISFLDGGLTADQIKFFNTLNINIIDPLWRNEDAFRRSNNKNYLKVEIAKVHLDLIFPESDIIAWIDADAWFQNFKALNIFQTVANKNKFAIVSQASRLHQKHLNYKHVFWNWVELRNILYKNARRADLPKSIIKNMMARPTLNAGIFALKQNAPHWERFRHWQEIILKGKRGRVFTATQLAFGICTYEEQLPYEALPDICNHMGPYRFDEKNNLFVDFYAPYDPISIIHMAGYDSIRKDRNNKISIPTIEEKTIDINLRFPAII